MKPEAPVMLDLFSGLGGASQAMTARGWNVIRVDNEVRRRTQVKGALLPHVVADVRALPLRPFWVDLLWSSPPCTDFTRWHLRHWKGNVSKPPLELVRAALETVARFRPRFWCIENVRGAVPFLGPPDAVFGPYFLWGHLPLVLWDGQAKRKGDSRLPHVRSRVPWNVSEAIALAVERCAGGQGVQERLASLTRCGHLLNKVSRLRGEDAAA